MLHKSSVVAMRLRVKIVLYFTMHPFWHLGNSVGGVGHWCLVFPERRDLRTCTQEWKTKNPCWRLLGTSLKGSLCGWIRQDTILEMRSQYVFSFPEIGEWSLHKQHIWSASTYCQMFLCSASSGKGLDVSINQPSQLLSASSIRHHSWFSVPLDYKRFRWVWVEKTSFLPAPLPILNPMYWRHQPKPTTPGAPLFRTTPLWTNQSKS